MTDIAPAKANIQQEEVDYRSALNESMLSKIGGSINFINENAIQQVGDVVQSVLSEVQFQAQRNVSWVLVDGRSVIGTDYETLTGQSNIPDMRGMFARMKDNGRSLDPQGDDAIGAGRPDTFANHSHSVTASPWDNQVAGPRLGRFVNSVSPLSIGTTAVGSSETAPKHIIFNFFIKINN